MYACFDIVHNLDHEHIALHDVGTEVIQTLAVFSNDIAKAKQYIEHDSHKGSSA